MPCTIVFTAECTAWGAQSESEKSSEAMVWLSLPRAGPRALIGAAAFQLFCFRTIRPLRLAFHQQALKKIAFPLPPQKMAPTREKSTRGSRAHHARRRPVSRRPCILQMCTVFPHLHITFCVTTAFASLVRRRVNFSVSPSLSFAPWTHLKSYKHVFFLARCFKRGYCEYPSGCA